MKTIVIVTACLFFCFPLLAIQVNGTALLGNLTNHTGIKVKFKAASLSAQSDSTLTDAAGNYSISISGGMYQVQFSKAGFQTILFSNNGTFIVGAATTLPTQTLQPGTVIQVSGAVSGVWNSGIIYYVMGDITVPTGQSLNIQPGVTVLFTGNYSLVVNGSMFCAGNVVSPVRFSTYISNANFGQWMGIYCYAGAACTISNTTIEHCINGVWFDKMNGTLKDCMLREFSATAVTLDHSSALISGCKIYNGDSVTTSRGIVAYVGQPVIECNSVWNVSGSGITCQSEGLYRNNVVYNIPKGAAFRFYGFANASITGNYAHHAATGFQIGESIQMQVTPRITNNTISNTNIGFDLTYPYSGATIVNNLVVNNQVGIKQMAGQGTANTPSVLSHNNFWNNSTADYSGVQISGLGQVINTYSNGAGFDSYYNISADPLFTNNPPQLSANSPCINTGNVAYGSNIGCNVNAFCVGMETGIVQTQMLSKMALFPNPSNEFFTLTLPEECNATISIVDVSGKTVLTLSQNTSTETHSIKALEAGVYFVCVKNNTGNCFQSKLIKQ